MPAGLHEPVLTLELREDNSADRLMRSPPCSLRCTRSRRSCGEGVRLSPEHQGAIFAIWLAKVKDSKGSRIRHNCVIGGINGRSFPMFTPFFIECIYRERYTPARSWLTANCTLLFALYNKQRAPKEFLPFHQKSFSTAPHSVLQHKHRVRRSKQTTTYGTYIHLRTRL